MLALKSVNLIFCLSLIKLTLSQECGISETGVSFSIGGEYARRGQFRWIAPLFDKTNKFFCGSSIISKRFLLSAAHCFQNKDVLFAKAPSSIYAYLGKFDFDDNSESNAVKADIQEIFLHPNWESFKSSYDGDIAVVKTVKDIAFNNYVQPVCLPSASDPIFNKDGVVVGWGRSEAQSYHETRPKFVKITSVDHAKCLFDEPILAKISSINMFCAGREGVNPCKGDSGSGFFVKTGSIYTINGVVSSALYEECADNKYSVFTSVIKYITWVKDQMDVDKREWNLKKLNCQYEYNDDEKRYECVDKSFNTQDNNIKISEVDGVFTDGRGPSAVDTVILGSKLKYVPEMTAVNEKFRNFNRLFIVNSGLKYVERSKLMKVPQLRILNFYGNEIESFDEDVLNDLLHLEIFAFVSNQVKVLPKNLLANQRKLKELWAWSNQIETIPANFFKNNKQLTHVWMSHNKINTISVDFKQLPNLIILDLQSNICIGEQMCGTCNDKTTSEIQIKINEKCSGAEADSSSDDFDCFKNSECNFVSFDAGFKCDVTIHTTSNACKLVTGGDLPSDKRETDVNAVRIYGTNVYLPDVTSVAARFPNIDHYDLGFMKLKHIRRKRLAPFKNKLIWISFFGNEIMEIAPDTFFDLSKVYKIILADNKLKTISRDLFSKNPKLSELWLQNNQLQALPEGLFRNNRELKEIFASDNKLTSIDVSFTDLPNFSKIDLRNNECIDKWCDTSNYCGTGSKEAMQKLIYKRC